MTHCAEWSTNDWPHQISVRRQRLGRGFIRIDGLAAPEQTHQIEVPTGAARNVREPVMS